MSSLAVNEYNDAAAAVPEEALLGSLVWYTISEVDIPVDEAYKQLKDRDLRTDMLKSIRPVDAYRIATRELKKNFPAVNGVKLNLMVRSKGHDSDTAFRQLVWERVNTKAGERRRLTYEASADLLYHRGSRNSDGEVTGDRIEIIHRPAPDGLDEVMTDEHREWIQNGLAALPDRFRHLRTHFGNHKIRNFIREYLKSLGAVSVRESGGVYFISQDHNDEMVKLGDWIEGIGSSFHGTPLLDLMNQREMLARSFEEEAIKEVQILNKEIEEILARGGKVREKTFDDYALRVAELTAKANDYADMLDIRSEIAHKHIEQFKRKTMELVDHIDYKE